MDDVARKAGLRLDDVQSALESKAIVPRNADQSELMHRVQSHDPDLIMPPPDTGHMVSAEEIQLLRTWIEQGAEYEKHWSFTPPKSIEPPSTSNDWSRHPIDIFIYQRLTEVGLEPNAEADKPRLLRRVSLDLTGLPPTLEQADAFLADQSENAFEKIVDQLLEAEAFGEHWARMWLDLARYADTNGYEKDRPRSIWRYRDWVIESLNRDLPYDQFTIEQLAGDLLPEPTGDQILATAFHRNTMENDEGGTDDEEFRVAAVKDRVDTTIQVWMGLTMGCAKCHSHKYDPITQKDYYQLYALFNQTADADRKQPIVPTPTVQQEQRIQMLVGEVHDLKRQLDEKSEDYTQALTTWRSQFSETPLWSPLTMLNFKSNHGVVLEQGDQGTFLVKAELPELDTWELTVELPDQRTITSIRLETDPKPEGGVWKDKNVALRELTAELIEPGKAPRKLELVQPRADFSQRGWEVARAIDGKPDAGWAFSPKAAEPHCAVFDFAVPIDPKPGNQLRLTLQQEYGQGLVLKSFRILVSSYPTDWLTAQIDPSAGLETVFQKLVYAKTKQIHEQITNKEQVLKQTRQEIPSTPVMRELPEDKQRETRIHVRGNFLDPGERVTGDVPTTFGEVTDDWPRNRLGVAQWLLQADNPLTARVAVNRIWAQLFGTGLVLTEEDFGTQGAIPSHPELLDWLAVEFRAGGWSLKKLLKTIVLSKTYRQSSVVKQEHLDVDPRNRLLSRGARFRLSAEMVRDQALAASGLLIQRIGGPSVMPPQPDGIWKSTYSGEKWKNDTGSNRYRRALYTYKKRTSPYPAMTTFDSGSGEVCQIRRVRTNTPLQALVTLNDTAFVEAAGALASRMEQSAQDLPEQIANGFRMVLTRHAEPEELNRLVELYDALKDELLEGQELRQSAGVTTGDARLIAVANVLLNLDETLMKP